MTKFYFVRHGEATYSPIDERGFIGHGRDLAPLTDRGVAQIEKTAEDSKLEDCEIILASPYTRALQSAAIISRKLNLDIRVEMDLHEWLPDMTFQFKTSEEAFLLCHDFNICNGVYPENDIRNWETLESMKRRMESVLERYMNYRKVAVVCHGMVIRSLIGMDMDLPIANGEIIEFNKRSGHPRL